MSTRKFRWIIPTLALLALASLVPAQAPPQLPTGMVKSSPTKGLQAAVPGSDYVAPSGLGSGLLSRGAPSPGLIESSGGPGIVQWTEPTMVLPFSNAAPGSTDATWQTMDVSAWVPPGAQSVYALLQVFAGTSGTSAEILLRPVGFTSDASGNDTILHNDGATVRYQGSPPSGYSPSSLAEIPVSPDRKLQFRRINTAGSNYFYFQIVGWKARYGIAVSPPQIVVPSVTGAYPAWPWAYRDDAGNVHVGYVDSPDPDTLPATHTTNHTAWYIRNDGTPAILFSLAQLGCSNVSDVWFYQVPGSTVLHALIRQDDGTVYGHMHATSTDRGLTWSAPALIAAPQGFPGFVAFFDGFIQSTTGDKLLATCYGNSVQTGTDWSVALMESADGVTWTRRSWINQFATASLGLTETGLVRMPSGRLIVTFRPPTNGQQGYTRYSDDDGVTWSSLVQQGTGARWCPARGIAVGSSRAIAYGRYFNVSNNPGLSFAYWVLDASGTVLSGPHHIDRIFDASAGGYASIVRGATGYEMWRYGDLNSGTNYGPNLLKANVQVLLP